MWRQDHEPALAALVVEPLDKLRMLTRLCVAVFGMGHSRLDVHFEGVCRTVLVQPLTGVPAHP